MYQPGQILMDMTPGADLPLLRIICRYPFDRPEAGPRWVCEHLNQPEHKATFITEIALSRYEVMATAKLEVALS